MALGRLSRSLTFRLALVYLALFAGSVGLMLAIAYWAGVARPKAEVRAGIRREAAVLSDIYVVDGRAALVRALGRRATTVAGRKPFHAFIAPDGRTVAANLSSWPRTGARRWLRFEADLYVDGDEEDHEAFVHDELFRDGSRLIVGRDIEDIDEREELIAQLILWGVAAVLILGLAGGLLMSLAVGRRLDTINSAARRVIGGDLSGRVATRGTGDDFDRLGATLNLMLGRIEALVEAVSRVSDSIAHELRTPLARLHADLEDLASTGDEAERQRLTEQALGETARLRSTFDALLRIARLETGRHVLARREVELARLLRDAAEFHCPDAEDQGKSLVVDVDDRLRADADPDLLFQAVSNLLDNAIKHTPAGSRIRLVGRTEPDGASVEVADDGVGIPEQHRARVLERFYRAPGSQHTPGLGLGLSLVDAVARAHGATLEIADAGPGLRVRLRLRDTTRRTGAVA